MHIYFLNNVNTLMKTKSGPFPFFSLFDRVKMPHRSKMEHYVYSNIFINQGKINLIHFVYLFQLDELPKS